MTEVSVASAGKATPATVYPSHRAAYLAMMNREFPVAYVALSKSALMLKLGRTYTLKATVRPAYAPDKTTTWTTSDAPVPPELLEWLLYGAAGGIVICAVQLCVSLVIRSFAVPVGIALMGGVAGLAALAKGCGAFFPYSLLSLGMRANRPGGEMMIGVGQFLASGLFYLAACVAFALIWMRKRDVTAG